MRPILFKNFDFEQSVLNVITGLSKKSGLYEPKAKNLVFENFRYIFGNVFTICHLLI